MGIRIISKEREKPFRLWLPGILIFFLIFLAFLIFMIPIIIVLIGLLIWNLIPGEGKKARAYTRIIFSVPKVFFALKGLTVDVESNDAIVKIKF